jgi:hypothetical protein
MALRWAAVALVATEKTLRKLQGHKLLWMLKAYLDETEEKLAERSNMG